MTWDFKYSGQAEFFRELASQGIPVDEEAIRRPLLYDDLNEVYGAFTLLSTGRQYNEAGPQPLSLVDIVAMMNELNIKTQDERLEFHRYVRALDVKLLEMIHAKMKQDRERLLNKTR